MDQYRHFAALAGPEQFVAVTDPGTPLARLAERDGFRRLFLDPPGVGARYSVLSICGLLPAALMGIDIEELIHGSQVAEQTCAHYDSSEANAGVWLGAVMGELARCGRDKLTFVVAPPMDGLGRWIEHIVAGSLAGSGRGIVPVTDEPLGAPDAYGPDRTILYVRGVGQPVEDFDEQIQRLADAGQPTLTLRTTGTADLGRIFFLTQFAVAVAAWALEVDPFAQPSLHDAADYQWVLNHDGQTEVSEASDERLRALLDAGPPSYVAVVGYLEPTDRVEEAITELRAVIRSFNTVAVTFDYGPRHLHATGRLHRRGPATGRFLQLVDDPRRDAEVPDAGYSFGSLTAAQAAWDLQGLRAQGLPAERVRLTGDPASAVRSLTERISDLLEPRPSALAH